jgi:replication-associated recombination protein RarA
LPEKDKILYLLNRLENNKINKLSLLLYGEPGCGKTSIIRALSNYLKYDIMEIKLSEIKTDLELFNLFYNKSFKSAEERDDSWG